MSKDLFEARAALAVLYATANEAVVESREKCAAAKQHIIEFDDAHPEVMRAVKDHANRAKREAGAEARKSRAAKPEAEAEGGDE